MPLHFITGAPGSGKTAVTNELAARGFNAYDTDDPHRTGMAGWHNLATGKYVAGFNEIEVTKKFVSTHIWRLADAALDDFRSRSLEKEPVYLCGRLRDPRPVLEMSRHVLFLTATGQTIKNRLRERAQLPGEVTWGQEPWQVKLSVAVSQGLEEEYKRLGAFMVDTQRPPAEVADVVIALTAQS